MLDIEFFFPISVETRTPVQMKISCHHNYDQILTSKTKSKNKLINKLCIFSWKVPYHIYVISEIMLF